MWSEGELHAVRRMPSYNPFTAPNKNGEYHTLRTIASVRRITSGEAPGSPLGPRRSAVSVPALVRPKGSKRVSLEIDDRRRTSESFLWENEPMSAAAVLGNPVGQPESVGRSIAKRSSSNASLDDAASCLWENEPMSAAASLVSITRSGLPRVPEAEQTGLDPEPKSMPRLNINTARHSHHGAVWRPRRPAPSPPQRANSFPNPQQNEDFLEYDITTGENGLTLQETPRSSLRDFKAAPPPVPAVPTDSAPVDSACDLAHHHNAPDPISNAVLPPSPEPAATATSDVLRETAVPTIAHLQVHDACTAASTSADVQAQGADPAFVGQIASDDSIINRFIEDALQLSRKGSAATLYESAHSGSAQLADDVSAG